MNGLHVETMRSFQNVIAQCTWTYGIGDQTKAANFLNGTKKKLKALMGKNVISSCNGTVFTAEMWGN